MVAVVVVVVMVMVMVVMVGVTGVVAAPTAGPVRFSRPFWNVRTDVHVDLGTVCTHPRRLLRVELVTADYEYRYSVQCTCNQVHVVTSPPTHCSVEGRSPIGRVPAAHRMRRHGSPAGHSPMNSMNR